MEVASLVVEHRLQGERASVVVAPRLWSTGSAVVHGLRCSMACGIFPDQGLNPCLLHWQADSLPLSHWGSRREFYFPPSSFGFSCECVQFASQLGIDEELIQLIYGSVIFKMSLLNFCLVWLFVSAVITNSVQQSCEFYFLPFLLFLTDKIVMVF